MKKILITGANGLVGSAIRSIKQDFLKYEFIFCGKTHGDLTKEKDVKLLYEIYKPNYVVHTAAKVGGVGGNAAHHADYFYDNILMNTYMIHYAYKYQVEKMLVFSSVCAFPHNAQILKEELIQEGEPFPGNFAYGYAKRMADVQISAYKAQYKVKNYCSIVPCNIIGENDLYNIEHGHVLPALIHKLYLAKKNKQPLKVWGDGSSSREFIYSKDLANFIMKILSFDDIPQRVIISGNKQYTIKEVVEKLCVAADFRGEVVWETDKPNGQKARPTDLSLLHSLVGDVEYTDFDVALRNSYKWFEDNYLNVRL